MQAIVLEGRSGRSVGLPVLCPAVTIPQRWCVLSSVCEAVSVRIGPTYMKTDVSPSRSVLVTLVSLAIFEDASILYTYYIHTQFVLSVQVIRTKLECCMHYCIYPT